jgi:hypothetical protein
MGMPAGTGNQQGKKLAAASPNPGVEKKGTNEGKKGTATSKGEATSPQESKHRDRLGDERGKKGDASQHAAAPQSAGRNDGEGLPYPGMAAKRVPAPPISRLMGNRDWQIPVQCERDRVVLPLSRGEFATNDLLQKSAEEHLLSRAVRDIVERRQASVRPGEPPYRPILRFEVAPDGLLTYHLAYPILERLGLPMVRHNVEPRPPDLSDYYRK